jgi:membrane protease YdiL (CAAX protease family)
MEENKITLDSPIALPPIPQANLFRNERGIRAGWRLLMYTLMVVVVASVLRFIFNAVYPHPHGGTPPPGLLLFSEAMNFLVIFGVAFVMSRIERRPVGAYGIPAGEAFGKKFWLGALFGILEISALVGLIALFGGYSFGPIALHGNQIFQWASYYVVFFVFVGFFEEFLFRGYTQFTLGEGIGFWPAAAILSFLFGFAHYFNEGEGIVGAASVVLVAMLFAFTLRRSGNLWYAIGLHAAFDFGETFLYSVPDSGFVFPGHLSDAVLHGPRWLTGGTVGPEGSVFCFLTMGLQFLVVLWLFPKHKSQQPADLAAVPANQL